MGEIEQKRGFVGRNGGPTKTKVSFQNMAEACVESEWCRNSLIFIVSSSDLKKSMW